MSELGKHLHLGARFDLDPATGAPQFIEDAQGLKHYRIILSAEDVDPGKIKSVTFKLHDSYYDPVREVFSDSSVFEEPITSFGDYQIQVSPSGLAGHVRIGLADALEGSVERSKELGGDQQAIRRAIEDIRSY